MSRVGKNAVAVPQGVEVKIDGQVVTAKGQQGQLAYEMAGDVVAEMGEDGITVRPLSGSKQARAMWGTARSRIQNLVTGVAEGFRRDLEIIGVGYRASVQGASLNLQLGFSHEVNFPIPEGIKIQCEKPTAISVFGADKQKVGQVAAEIRSYRPPEPYKGKGIRYVGEFILRKEGKKK